MFLVCEFPATHPAADTARAVVSRWEQEHQVYYQNHPTLTLYGRAGFQALPGGGRWLSSGGNYTAVQELEGTVIVTVHARRHGLPFGVETLLRALWPEGPTFPEEDERGIFNTPDVRVLAYDTQEPRWVPWATRDHVVAMAEER